VTGGELKYAGPLPGDFEAAFLRLTGSEK
jgi:hypothetical protein